MSIKFAIDLGHIGSSTRLVYFESMKQLIDFVLPPLNLHS